MKFGKAKLPNADFAEAECPKCGEGVMLPMSCLDWKDQCEQVSALLEKNESAYRAIIMKLKDGFIEAFEKLSDEIPEVTIYIHNHNIEFVENLNSMMMGGAMEELNDGPEPWEM